MMISRGRKLLLLLIPAVVVGWSLFLRFYFGPYELRDIDPEYIYLISGMNSATLEFNKIGHVDHPGTPLQLLTGLFLRLIHFTTGQQDFVTDVITAPGWYLTLSSLMLTAITFLLLFRLGMQVYRYTRSMMGAFILQASGFYSVASAGILYRYSPDRLITVLVLLFFLLYIRALHERRWSDRRFSVLSGIIMGAGLVTKLNFLPLLIIPPILVKGWKNRWIYVYSLAGSVLLFILPVSSKYRVLWGIIRGTIVHKGLYGAGEKGILDISSFLPNIARIFGSNPSFAIITLLAAACFLWLLFSPTRRRTYRTTFRFLGASLLAIVLGLVITAKHFKGYYALPILCLTPMLLFKITRLIQKDPLLGIPRWTTGGLLVLLLLFPVMSLARYYSRPNDELRNRRAVRAFMEEQISPADYVIVTPSWMASPVPGSGMVLGVSYFHLRERSYLAFERTYPRLLTWEGKDVPLKHMRMKDANLEEALLSGNNIYLYSAPGWNAPELCRTIERQSLLSNVKVFRDTVYSNVTTGEQLIRYCNSDGWRRTDAFSCGFEQHSAGSVYADNGQMVLNGEARLTDTVSAHGTTSLELDRRLPESPAYLLKGIRPGDVVSASVKVFRDRKSPPEPVSIRCEYLDPEGNRVVLASDPEQVQIDEKWYQVSLYGRLPASSADTTLRCFIRSEGTGTVIIDDFILNRYSRN